MAHKPPSCRSDPWLNLRSRTSARIALGRSGDSLPTQAWLEFKAAHAAARDAVWLEFDVPAFEQQFIAEEWATVVVQTQARDKSEYLQYPDRGRRLQTASADCLRAQAGAYDLVICVSDGLSALAAIRHACTLCKLLRTALVPLSWQLAPLVIARHGRVALQDEIGDSLGARIALMLIGERPGLGSPDSLGAYLVHDPTPGRTDAERNCVSNIRPQGLGYAAAAATLLYLLTRAHKERLSGVSLKDERSRNRNRVFPQGTTPGLAAPDPDCTA